jgi:hypothetical protein
MEYVLAVADTKNVFVVMVHYLSPAVIILVFSIASISSAVGTSGDVVGSPVRTHSNLTVWLFVLALLTFVLPGEISLTHRSLMELLSSFKR